MLTLLASLFMSVVLISTSGKPAIYTDLPYKFTLAAWNVTRPNANATGVPLVLGEKGANDGASFQLTSTYASFPYNIYPALSLSNQSLRAYRASGFWLTNATSLPSGAPLLWFTSSLFDHDAVRIYTVIQRLKAKFPMLAAHGISDMWSLCPFDGKDAQMSIVFNVSADFAIPSAYLGFDPRLCWPVKIHIVEAKDKSFFEELA
ncbi:hypothetical protein C8J57DRAFT_1339840 [Mycena rebaudengoi]|nr:hypothetical protein C8J57DRAFT_1339840 [Mycena rebaudengoi]